jgi:LPXTG-site transpeptidase (sortase) family protein
LSIGDEVVITNLWERLRYRVVGTKIIEPHEIENILIQPGRDMVTLLTCHPYASGGKQRYLVYCQRIPEYGIMEVPYD